MVASAFHLSLFCCTSSFQVALKLLKSTASREQLSEVLLSEPVLLMLVRFPSGEMLFRLLRERKRERETKDRRKRETEREKEQDKKEERERERERGKESSQRVGRMVQVVMATASVSSKKERRET